MADREVDLIMDKVGRKRPDAFEGPAGQDLEMEGTGHGQHGEDSERYHTTLPRYMNLSAAVNFGYIILCSWEAFAVTFQFALYNGGPASLVYGSIIAGVGATATAMSLAELAAIDPTVGAQYRWSASLAPFNGRFFGLLQGWITLFAWMVAAAGPPAIIANIIIPLAKFNYPDYSPPFHNWHTMLIMWLLIAVPFVMNLWVRRFLNVFETLGGILHFLFFVASIIVLLVLARRSTNEFVWDTLFVDLSGWKNPAINFNIGLLTCTFSVTGFDGVIHMSDEVKSHKTRVPRSIIVAAVANSIMMFAFAIVMLYCLGDLDTVLGDTTGLPLIQVFYGATKSKAGATIMVVLPAIVLFVCIFNAFASVSRLTWAFARDRGLPFSDFFSYVSPTYQLPLNALYLVGVITLLLSVLYPISVTAFNAIISLQAISLSVSYIMPILFILIRKIKKNDPPYGSYKMASWYSIPINVFSLIYLIYVIIWMPFPTVLPISADNFNYSGPILGFVICLAIGDYIINGKNRFEVPMGGMLAEVDDRKSDDKRSDDKHYD